LLNKLKLFGIFLVIPIICFFALGSALSDQDRLWTQELQQHVPVGRMPEFALSVVCYNTALRQKFDLTPVCSPYTNTQRLRVLALFTPAAAILFAGLVMMAGLVSKANRHVLLRVFRPGIVLCNVVVAVLLILQAVLLSGTVLYEGYDGVKSEDFAFYAALIGLASLAGVFFTIKPFFGVARRAEASVVGRSLKVSEYPTLWQFVEGLAVQTGSDSPQNLIVGLTPAFFVTEADVHCMDGKATGRTMYLSVPLCHLLTVEELSAVIAHELGHFRGSDTVFSLRFYPIYRGAVDSLQGVSQVARKIAKYGGAVPHAGVRILAWLGSLTLLPSIYMLAFFLECFAGAENRISREREIAADAVAADIAGAANIATALVKVVAFTGVWDHVISAMRDGLMAGYLDIDGQRYDAQQFFANVSEVYAVTVAQFAGSNALDGLDAKTIPHPTDSHPPLSIRLAALGASLSDIRSDALKLSPKPSSNEMIDNWQYLEGQLSMVEQALLAPKAACAAASPAQGASVST
jgi:Zn-dependent protease with chaperone function